MILFHLALAIFSISLYLFGCGAAFKLGGNSWDDPRAFLTAVLWPLALLWICCIRYPVNFGLKAADKWTTFISMRALKKQEDKKLLSYRE